MAISLSEHAGIWSKGGETDWYPLDFTSISMAEEFEDTKRVSEDINLMTNNAIAKKKNNNKDKQNDRENNSQTTKDWATRT